MTIIEDQETFTFQLLGWYTASAITSLIAVGSRVGLFDALVGRPATSLDLAERAGVSERHVREWLGGAAVAGIVEYEPVTATFSLPAPHAACLTGPTSANIGPLAQAVAFYGGHIPAVARTFEEGGGIPYEQFRPEFTELQDGITRRMYDDALVDAYLPAVPGLVDRLRTGAAVADLGCGTGHAVNLMAQAFPASDFVGYDLGPDAIDQARDEARRMGLDNARFERHDVAMLPPHDRFDVVTAFDAIHDQARPRQVLAEVRRVIDPDGTFVMVDMNLSSNLEENIGNPVAPWLYTGSLFHCMQVSLAEGGEGLGAAWGRERATELLAGAGFGSIDVVPSPPQDPVNVIFVARP